MPTTKTYRILLVEDDEVDRMAFERFVRREDLHYNYTIATSVAEARQQLSDHHFDVALIDQSLGDGTGLELLEEIYDLPVIMITGSADLHTAVSVMKAGAFDFISKDPQGHYLEILPVTVDNTIKRWQAQQELVHYRNHLEQMVTERTNAWLQEQMRLQTVLESTSTLVFSLNPDATFSFLAGNSREILYHDRNDLIGLSLFEMFPNETSLKPAFERVLKGNHLSIDIALGERWLHLDLTLQSEADTTIIGVLHDVTERKQAEEQHIKTERLRIEIENERELVALKQRFIEMASHNFRTPLTIIKTSADLLETYVDRLTEENRRGKLKRIQKQVDYMTSLLNNVLTLSKLSAGKAELTLSPLDLHAFCNRLWEDMSGIDSVGHELEYHYNTTLENIITDENLLHQVLVNLLSNAFKYTPPERRIYFEVSNDLESLIFNISDQGMGIPKSDLKHMFEPFHRAVNVKEIEGTGLGLVIAKNYVALQGGTIDVDSEEGVGTTFTIRFPLNRVKP